MLTTYAQVIDWLLNLPPLDRTCVSQNLALLRTLIKMHQWQPTCPVITVTGTNGKGTCIHALAAIFRAAGYRVGTFTSPHLQRFNERIAINGCPIDDQAFVQTAQKIFVLGSALPSHFFSILLLMALDYFKHQAVDLLLLEVGVGGRLDPCNALDADINAITSIALDHQHLLGDTREQIAFEKAGLMRSGRLTVVGDRDVPATLKQQAAHTQARLQCLGQDFHNIAISEHHFSWQGKQWLLPDLTKPPVVLSNIAVALMITEALHDSLPVGLSAIRQALRQLQVPGRYQCLKYLNHTVILDVAHNLAAIEHLKEQLKRDWPLKPIHLIFGMMADKDWQSCLTVLSQLPLKHCYLPPLDDPRALNPQHLSQACLAKNISHQQSASLSAALFDACQQADSEDLIVVTGSFRLVGAALDGLEEALK